jgi:four helix bundle protein
MSDEKDDLRKRTKRFALRIIKVYESLPRSGSAQVLAHQLLRSGTSVGANFREAHRARSNAEFVSKVGFAKGTRRNSLLARIARGIRNGKRAETRIVAQ